MSRSAIDPSTLLGESIRGVIVGWHVHDAHRSASRLFLCFDSRDIEVHTAGDGSLALIQGPVPTDFSMDEYGSFEFREAAPDHPAVRLIGHRLTSVDGIHWRGSEVGLRLGTENEVVVLVNEADEVFVSDGALPPDYCDATIG